MKYGSQPWFDEEAGPLVRPFALTRGRARVDRHDLDMLTLVVAVRPESEAVAALEDTGLDDEHVEIVRLCQPRPVSVAELAAHLNLLLAVTKVLVSDLIEAGFLVHQSPPPPVQTPDMTILQAVLDGVRRL